MWAPTDAPNGALPWRAELAGSTSRDSTPGLELPAVRANTPYASGALVMRVAGNTGDVFAGDPAVSGRYYLAYTVPQGMVLYLRLLSFSAWLPSGRMGVQLLVNDQEAAYRDWMAPDSPGLGTVGMSLWFPAGSKLAFNIVEHIPTTDPTYGQVLEVSGVAAGYLLPAGG